MIRFSNLAILFRRCFLPTATLLVALSLLSTASRSANDEFETLTPTELIGTTIKIPATNSEFATTSGYRVAQKYEKKYEIPKAERRPTKRAKPFYEIPKADRAPQKPPPLVKKGGQSTKKRSGSTKKGRKKRSGSTKKQRSGSKARKVQSCSGVGVSCQGCRNSCYVRYRVQSQSKQFVPCMRRCWKCVCRN